MSKIKRFLPFGILPGSWGLKGKTRKMAEAEYYYDGYDLEIVTAGIENDSVDDQKIAKSEIDLKYNKKSSYELKILRSVSLPTRLLQSINSTISRLS